MRGIRTAVLILLVSGAANHALAIVNYDQGQRQIKGVQLLQDYSDPNAYYYVPQFPRLATRDDGTFELLCLKFVDGAGTSSGGVFHALVEFTLPADVVAELQKELKKEAPEARIVGPVPLMQMIEKGEDALGSFQIVSGTLSNKTFATSVVTSGSAPLLPGSKAAVAAMLSREGATLLWSSLQGPTSDVSVAIHAYYEAAVKAYNAKVTADVSTVYTHLSRISNQQQEYTRRQLRKIVDDLERNQVLKVEVLDRSAGLGIKAGDMDGILQAVTTKLTELMFDHKSGWAADPVREAAVEANQILGRQDRGWFASVFGGADDTKYYTDDQYVLKNRSDIRHNVFMMVLDKNTSIKVPVDTAGNLRGLYRAIGREADNKYFRVVNLDDPDFERRDVHFNVDSAYAESFADVLNFVSVNFRKRYEGQPDVTRQVLFNAEDIKQGKVMKDATFPRLGESRAAWTEFEYQVRWSLRDGPTVSYPADPERWIKTKDPAVPLTPPFEKRIVEVDYDKQLFTQRGISSAVVEFATVLGGKPRVLRKVVLRPTDTDSTRKIAIYRDRDTPAAMRISFYSPEKTVKGDLQVLDTEYLLVTPPAPPPPPPGGGSQGGHS